MISLWSLVGIAFMFQFFAVSLELIIARGPLGWQQYQTSPEFLGMAVKAGHASYNARYH